jgi:diphosphomevalonate decarboxylase
LSRVLVRAPSNIALVKYMGKSVRPGDEGRNIPENSSLSMTLSNLCTFVELRTAHTEEGKIDWVPEIPAGARGEVPKLDEKGIEKFVRHFELCRERAGAIARERRIDLDPTRMARASFGAELRSANTFPHSAGIASSASSFAALTLATFAYFARDPAMFQARFRVDAELRRSLAALSREGSGSSCRSFEGPFVSWTGERAVSLSSHLPRLSDLVIVVSAGEKKVGSSEAHRRVRTSPHWEGRVARAEKRHGELIAAISKGDFPGLSAIAEADFRDMHQLFETASPAFSYFVEGTEKVLEFLENEVDGTVAVTMDAGPNVHLIVPQSQEAHWKEKLTRAFPEYPVMVDREGAGAEIVAFGDDKPRKNA